MQTRKSVLDITFDALNGLFMIFLMTITLYPFVYIIFASLSDPGEMMRTTGLLLYPKGFNLAAYQAVFKNSMIKIGYMNTVINVVFGIIVNVILTSFGAYVLSRKGLYWRNLLMFVIVFTMFFNGGLIPFYLTVMKLGMLDTRLALIIPTAISTWNLIIMRTSFLSVPDSMEESAVIDGANDFTILFLIILPLSLPIVSVMLLFYGVSQWNAWFNAMIFLKTRELYPLQLVLREILVLNSTDSMTAGDNNFLQKQAIGETIKYATIIVATLPILFVYPFLQKYFVKGVMIGALKE